jgi:nicotinate-nucleotide adenylyltransferase
MCARESDPSPLTSHPLLRKLGLLGGSFNPIHNAHLTIARLVRDQLRLDQVLFIPTGDPPHKRDGSLAPAKDRYEMVRLAIAGTPSFQLSDI